MNKIRIAIVIVIVIVGLSIYLPNRNTRLQKPSVDIEETFKIIE